MNRTIAEVQLANAHYNKRFNESADKFNKAQHRMMLIMFHINRCKYGSFIGKIKSRAWLFINMLLERKTNDTKFRQEE